MKRVVHLEKEAEKVCDDNSNLPLIFQLRPGQGRKVLDDAQDTHDCKYLKLITIIPINTSN